MQGAVLCPAWLRCVVGRLVRLFQGTRKPHPKVRLCLADPQPYRVRSIDTLYLPASIALAAHALAAPTPENLAAFMIALHPSTDIASQVTLYIFPP